MEKLGQLEKLRAPNLGHALLDPMRLSQRRRVAQATEKVLLHLRHVLSH